MGQILDELLALENRLADAAVVRIEGLGAAGQRVEIALFVKINVAIGIPATTKN